MTRFVPVAQIFKTRRYLLLFVAPNQRTACLNARFVFVAQISKTRKLKRPAQNTLQGTNRAAPLAPRPTQVRPDSYQHVVAPWRCMRRDCAEPTHPPVSVFFCALHRSAPHPSPIQLCASLR